METSSSPITTSSVIFKKHKFKKSIKTPSFKSQIRHILDEFGNDCDVSKSAIETINSRIINLLDEIFDHISKCNPRHRITKKKIIIALLALNKQDLLK